MKYKTLLVDYDRSSIASLNKLLHSIYAPCEIIGEAENSCDALKIINKCKPDLVFMDMGLPGMNGVELLRRCIHNPFIIFTSALDKLAIEAFEANTVAFIHKPVTLDKLRLSLSKLHQILNLSRDVLRSFEEKITGSSGTTLEYLPVKSADSIILLPFEHICFIQADGKYTIITTFEKKYVSNYSISELEEKYLSNKFLRLNRSYIVNVQYVKELKRFAKGQWHVSLSNSRTEELIVSDKYYEQLCCRLKLK
jgi:two-component system LytT family response regulator